MTANGRKMDRNGPLFPIHFDNQNVPPNTLGECGGIRRH
jgi:hypothetical protein